MRERPIFDPKEMDTNDNVYDRILSLADRFSSAFISAHQYATKCNQGVHYTTSENSIKSKILKSILLQKGFSVSTIQGRYVYFFETDQQVEQETIWYLVININKMPTFQETISELAKRNDQEYFELQDPGKTGHIITANDCVDNYFGQGKSGKLKSTGEFFVKNILSLDKGESARQVISKPFIFEKITSFDERWSNLSKEEKHDILLAIMED